MEEISTANEMQKEKLMEANKTIKELSVHVKVKDKEIETCKNRYVCVYVYIKIFA